MTAFADYLDLRTAVIDDVGRPDLARKFDRITKLAEAWLNTKLRFSDQITDDTVTFSSGSAALPADCLQVIGLYDSNGYEYVQQPAQSVKTTASRGFYSEQGGNLVSATITGTLTLQYYAKLSTLTASMATSNWLLQKYPSVYLYAVGAEAAKAAKDLELASGMMQLRDLALSEATADDTARRYARARVRVEGPTP